MHKNKAEWRKRAASNALIMLWRGSSRVMARVTWGASARMAIYLQQFRVIITLFQAPARGTPMLKATWQATMMIDYSRFSWRIWCWRYVCNQSWMSHCLLYTVGLNHCQTVSFDGKVKYLFNCSVKTVQSFLLSGLATHCCLFVYLFVCAFTLICRRDAGWFTLTCATLIKSPQCSHYSYPFQKQYWSVYLLIGMILSPPHLQRETETASLLLSFM